MQSLHVSSLWTLRDAHAPACAGTKSVSICACPFSEPPFWRHGRAASSFVKIHSDLCLFMSICVYRRFLHDAIYMHWQSCILTLAWWTVLTLAERVRFCANLGVSPLKDTYVHAMPQDASFWNTHNFMQIQRAPFWKYILYAFHAIPKGKLLKCT